MKYLIIGCGRVGATLAKLLTAEAHDVTVVDENPAAFKRMGNAFSGRVEVGTGIDYDVLKRAGAESADGFVAVTDGDNRNVMAALIAQRMFGIKKIVARIYDPPRGQLYRELGIETVCPTTIGAKIVRDKLMHMPYESVPSFDYGKVSSLAVTLRDVDAGVRVGDLERPSLVRIAAVRRGPRVTVAAPDDVLQEGDEINAIVAPEGLSDFVARFASPSHDAAIRLTA
jgi:trk system potassium uptake protein TrkA